ncbi:MAG: putative membrane protein YfcA, partial [Saprospiraceae bacterium]
MTLEASLNITGIAALLIAGLIGGFINTLAGGGSMLTLPALMMLGMPADVANATNRV